MSIEEEQPPQEEPFAPFIQTLHKAMESVAASVQQAVTVIMPAIQQISDALWEKYRQAGSPYGETQEGLLKWIEDMGEINHKQQEIERILMHHQMLIDARALGEKWRAKRAEEQEHDADRA